jgi:hypothetical protein
MKLLRNLCLVIILLHIFSGCERDEILQQVPDPTDSLAVINFLAADSSCGVLPTEIVLYAGKAVSISQQIEIELKVSKKGLWSLVSDTTNGLFFTASGSFSDTGKQQVSLQAKGTPLLPGSYLQTIKVGNNTRKILVSVLNEDFQAENVPLESYFRAKIGGVDVEIAAQTNSPEGISYGSGGKDSVSFASFINNPTQQTPGSVTLQKAFIPNFPSSTESDFKNFFQPGSYPFAIASCNSMMQKGIVFIWGQPPSTEFYISYSNFGDQSGSAFKITAMQDGHTSNGRYYVKIRARFNCKLYHIRTGEIKILTDGEMVSYFFRR